DSVSAGTQAAMQLTDLPLLAQNARNRAASEGSAAGATQLLDRIVRGLARDHYIVHVAFPQAGAADANEARLLEQLRNRRAATVTHAGFQSADHLVNNHCDGPAVGHSSLDAFRNELRQAVGVVIR